jgi:hypothetical protein
MDLIIKRKRFSNDMDYYYYNMLLKKQIVTFTPIFRDKIIINVYSGLANAHMQQVHFKKAKSSISEKFDNLNVIFNEMDVDDFKRNIMEKNWTYKSLVDWLLSSHIHFIICHPHQGFLEKGIDITPIEFYNELQRLKFHIGFPNGDELRCPVFTQNKAIYLKALYQNQLSNPTFYINVKDEMDLYRNDLKSFFDKHSELKRKRKIEDPDIKTGYILKTPFSNNRRNKVEYESNGDEFFIPNLLTNIVEYQKQFQDVKIVTRCVNASLPIQRGMPYFMIQPIMSNRKEYKVILFNHKALYISGSPTQTLGHSFSKENLDSILTFSENALRACKTYCPYMITDGLIRIDIFENQKNLMIVNEIESIEAKYPHATKIEITGNLESKLQLYWTDKLDKYIHLCIKKSKFN